MSAEKSIEVVPLELAHGRSFSHAVVICDEAQNTLILNGDTAQVDHRETPALKRVIDMVDRYDLPVAVIEFDEDDIVRSDVCAQWVRAFNRERHRA